MGCSREKREETPHDHLRYLKVAREMVVELTQTYRKSRSLWNIIDNLTADINTFEARVKELDDKAVEEMKQSQAYKELVETIEESVKTEP
jgi:hypothetical protein